MNIFIAGGTGFIGKTLVNGLRKYNWTIIKRDIPCDGEGYICEDRFLNDELPYNFDTFIISIGSGIFKVIEDITKEDFRKAYEDNLEKPFLYLKRALEIFKKRGEGNIIVINSISGIYPYRYGTAYSGFKAALSMIVKVARKENNNKSIKIGQIFLPPVDSPMIRKIPKKIKRGLISENDVIKTIQSMIEKCENRDIIIKRKVQFK